MLPVRPWVLAGDDLVLVCESRIAWSLAAAITEWLDADDLADDDPRAVLDDLFTHRPTIGVGIAVVPVGYPLIRAHSLGQALCKHAKVNARQQLDNTGDPHHGIDWRRGEADPGAVIDNRARRFPTTLRPYVFARGDTETFGSFTQQWLSDDTASLRGLGFTEHRSWSRSTLRDAALQTPVDHKDLNSCPVGVALGSLNRARRIQGRQALRLPEVNPPVRAAFFALDAIDLLDEHLQLIAQETDATCWARLIEQG